MSDNQTLEQKENNEKNVINVTIRCWNASKLKIEIPNPKIDQIYSIGELKDKIYETYPNDAPEPNLQRLVYGGRVLKDEMTVASYDIQDNSTIHLVRAAKKNTNDNNMSSTTSTSTPAPAPAPASAPAPAPGMPDFNSLFQNLGAFGGLNNQQNNDGNNQNNPFGNLGNLANLMQPNPQQMQQMQQQLMQNPELMRNIMQSPMMQNMLQNPDLMRNMIRNNPQMRELLDNNPQLNHIFNDPEILRQSMEMASDPQRLQQAMREQDLALSQLENHPEGYNALLRMYHDVQEPMMNAMRGGMGRTNQNTTNTTPVDTTGPLPNPWASNNTNTTTNNNTTNNQGNNNPFGQLPMMNLFGNLGQNQNNTGQNQNNTGNNNMGNLDFSSFLNAMQTNNTNNTRPTTQDPPEVRFANQLNSLNEMGFTDRERNIDALTRANGNVNRAIELLLSG